MRQFLNRAGLAVGAIRPTAIHSFWSKPSSGPITIPDFELLTIIVGIIAYKKACGGLFVLYSDDAGIKLFKELGILQLYDAVEPIRVDPAINPKMFWAAGKIDAYSRAPVPFVSMDFDAYVLSPFWQGNMHDVMPLNPEPMDWECYRTNEQDFKNFINIHPVDWTSIPYNVGVLGMFNSRFRDRYVDISNRFMSDYSRFGNPPKPYFEDFEKKTGVTFFGEMVFAEQRMLDIVARSGEFSLKSITGFDAEGFKCADNKYASHLWTKKKILKSDAALRRDYIKGHLDWLLMEDGFQIDPSIPAIWRLYEEITK